MNNTHQRTKNHDNVDSQKIDSPFARHKTKTNKDDFELWSTEEEEEEETIGEKKRKHNKDNSGDNKKMPKQPIATSTTSFWREIFSDNHETRATSIGVSKSPTSSPSSPSSILSKPTNPRSNSLLPSSHFTPPHKKETQAAITTTVAKKTSPCKRGIEWEFLPQTQTVEVQFDDERYIMRRNDTVSELIRRISNNFYNNNSSKLRNHHSWLEHIGGKKIDSETELEYALPKATLLHISSSSSSVLKDTKEHVCFAIIRSSSTAFETSKTRTTEGSDSSLHSYRTLKKENKRLREEIELAKQLLNSYQSLLHLPPVKPQQIDRAEDLKTVPHPSELKRIKDSITNNNSSSSKVKRASTTNVHIDLSDEKAETMVIDRSKNTSTPITPITPSPSQSKQLLSNSRKRDVASVARQTATPVNDSVEDRKRFKYVAVIRKKAEREKLKGSECEHCKKWYDALEESGDLKNKTALLNSCSRHKHLHSPPTTPPSFWDLDFPI